MTDLLPYRDPSLPVIERVNDLLGRMTLEEKVGQMCQYLLPDEGIEALPSSWDDDDDATMRYSEASRTSVPDLIARGLIGSILSVTDPARVNAAQRLAASSRLGIPLLFGIDAIHGNAMHPGATVFPAPIGLAATWDRDLVRGVAKVTARETRACNLHWTFSPNVDVLRDGRWGRSGETFGESPYLVGQLGVAMIEGYQDEADAGAYVMACAKHYIAGGEPANGLNFAAMDLSERALREVFLPPFADAVAAGVDTVMVAHNEVNGVPCHGNRALITDLLRGELGFEGFVVSDFTDIARLYTLHRVATSLQEADRQAVEAGIDMHMHGPGFLEPIVELVEREELDIARIEQAVRLILTAKFRLGLFEQRYVEIESVSAELATPAHQALALEAARKSLVLLKNENGSDGSPLLPLDRSVPRLFITGPHAHSQSLLGDWALEQPAEAIVTVLQGLQAAVSVNTVVDYLDCGGALAITDEAIETARERAAAASAAVVVVGENSLRYTPDKTEGENIDRTDLDLPGRQQELVDAVLASGVPTVVVLVNGRPQSVSRIAANAPALLETFHAGMRGGQAIADALFGLVNPGGRLPYTVPRTVGQLRAIHNHRPADYFRQYCLTPNEPLYPFGYGLSYTTFDYGELVVPEQIRAGDDVPVTVTVTNTGDREGDEVVIVYVHDLYASVTRPVKEVAAFSRLTLTRGETQTVTLVIDAKRLALHDREMNYVIEPGEFEVYVGDQIARFAVV
jgi:beta-glucosidase